MEEVEEEFGDGDNKRANGGQKTKKKKNEAERITALLQKGLQFARMGENANEESKKFEDEDIDTILSKRADVKAIGTKKGNAFSTFTFDAREEEDKKKFGDDIDPAEYWKTMFPDAARKAEEEKKNRGFIDERLIVTGRRNRVNNFGDNLNLSLLEGGRTRGREERDVSYKNPPSKNREKKREGRDKTCWTHREIKIVFDSMFAYGCPYEDTRRVILSREVKESIVTFFGRSEQEIKAVARSLLGIFDVLRKDGSVTARTLANTDSLSTNAFPRFENLFVDVKKAFENRQNRLVERKCLADLFEKTRTDEDYVWKPDELPTLKDEREINDVSMLTAQTWYDENSFYTPRSWSAKHDLALLRGSLEIGYSPWNASKVNEQLEAIFYEKQIGSIFVDATAAHDASRHSPSQYPLGLHPQLSSPPPLPPPPPPPPPTTTTTTTTPMELEEFKNFARTRLPFLLSRISGLKITNTRNVHSSFTGTSNLGAAQKLQWTDALKQKLYSALEDLMKRYQRIGPKSVCDEMGVPEVTRDNVASYLQRVRKDEVNQSDLSMRLWKYEKEIFPTAEHEKNTEHQLAATRPRRAEEGIKEVAKFQSENLYAMDLKHEHQRQNLLRAQNTEVQEKIDAGISNEYLRRIQDVHRQVMLRLIEQLDAEKEGFTKRCEAQLKRLKEEEEKKHLKEEDKEEEVRRFGDDNEDERRSEHPEVIELLSDDDDDDE